MLVLLVLEQDGLLPRRSEAHLDVARGSHLVRGSDQQALRMRPDVKTKILGAQSIATHLLDLLRELFRSFCDMGVPALLAVA